MRKLGLGIMCFVITIMLLAGCEDSTVSAVVISNSKLDVVSTANSSSAPAVKSGEDLYANVLFIESPKGMKYTAKWIKSGKTLKTDEQAMASNRKGVISFKLDGELTQKGGYTFEIYYKDKSIYSTDFSVS